MSFRGEGWLTGRSQSGQVTAIRACHSCWIKYFSLVQILAKGTTEGERRHGPQLVHWRGHGEEATAKRSK